MRFKADVSSLLTFTRVCESLNKLTKRCVLKLTPEMVHFIVSSGEDAAGVQVWASVSLLSTVDPLESKFDAKQSIRTCSFRSSMAQACNDYRVESNANNNIWIEIQISMLHQAFKSTTGATQVSIKLAKKDKKPILRVSLSVKTASTRGTAYEIVQDLPVKVIKPADAQMMKEPLCPDPDVHIVLPPLGGLLHTVERLGRVSHTLQLAVNHNGQLSLRAESDLASVQTDWRDLQQPDFSSDATQAPLATEDEARSGELKTEKMQFETVSVDQRSFVKFLSSHVIANTTVASICKGFACICYVYIGAGPDGGGVLTYFIPAVNRE